jgi:small subunit ribosomal protein S4e
LHVKRISAPGEWRITRKHYKWAFSPTPGPYPKNSCIPLAAFLRDYIGVCDDAKEAKRIVAGRRVMVDGKIITDPSFPLGLMSAVSVGDEHYRITLGYDGLRVTRIDAERAVTKLVRINNIMSVKGGKFQYVTHDGRSILLDEKRYATGTTLMIKVPEQEIMGAYELREGNTALITRGRHMGKTAKITGSRSQLGSVSNMVTFDGFEVPAQLVFVLGGENYE